MDLITHKKQTMQGGKLLKYLKQVNGSYLELTGVNGR